MSPDSYRVRFLHIAAAWAYGVSQPVFSLVGGNPELIAFRDVTKAGVIAFAVLFTVLPAIVVVGYVCLADRLSPWIGNTLYLSLFGVLLVPSAFQAVKTVHTGPRLSLVLVLALTTAGVLLYARYRVARLFVSYSIVLPLIGLVTFVHALPPLEHDASAAQVGHAPDTPVVIVVFDELPASSLMTRTSTIDGRRFPNFARLARDGTWYRNATTVYDQTTRAVPAIVTGKLGDPGDLPILAHHRENLFTMLGAGHALDVHEGGTRLCPDSSCPGGDRSPMRRLDEFAAELGDLYLRRVLPSSISSRLGDPDLEGYLTRLSSYTIDEYNAMVSALDVGQRQTLSFVHLLVPHAPWRFLPSGRTYTFHGIDGLHRDEKWVDDRWLVQQGFQRHLLQLQYADALLGRLLDRLQRERLYERTLLVVAADHGVSFRAGGARRPVTAENFADIANIPLFVKYPHQRRGHVDLRAARTIDIVPTVADVLGVDVPWRLDGQSLKRGSEARSSISVSRKNGSTVRMSVVKLVRLRSATIDQKYSLFGSDPSSFYRLGRDISVIGSIVPDSAPTSPHVRVRIEDAEKLAAVSFSSSFVPARISGVVAEGSVEPETELAIAVNGRIRALTRCFKQSGAQRFRAFVPESALREGPNRVEVLALSKVGDKLRLTRLGPFEDSGE